MDIPEIESRFLGTAGGLFFCVAEVGGFSGPLVMGALVDATGAFLAGACFCAFLNFIIIGLTFPLHRSLGENRTLKRNHPASGEFDRSSRHSFSP